MLTASDNLMASTAHHTTGEQDAALDTVWQALELQGTRYAYGGPDARYDAVERASSTIPGYDFLAGRIAGALGAPAVAGLEGDPLTQMLHDVYLEAQHAAESAHEAQARWHAACDADVAYHDRYPEERGAG